MMNGSGLTERHSIFRWADGEPGFSGGRYGVYYQGGSEEWHSGDVGYGTELAGQDLSVSGENTRWADAEVVGTSAKRNDFDERDIVLVLDVSGSMKENLLKRR